jgi:hypothetical protein
MTLYDFDIVEAHNIANQLFRFNDIKRPKVEALADILCGINPELRDTIKIVNDGWKGNRLAGYVFLCVDNIDLRRKIVEENLNNKYIKGFFDFRLGLTDAQHYSADWANAEERQNLLNSMNFSHEEAQAATPMSACNIALSVCPTVRMIAAAGVANFVNFVKGKPLKKMILLDAFEHSMIAI